jgi:glycosyltransferase involved in cell wall biosynthesis
MKELSIITVVKNGESTIEKTIQNVIRQKTNVIEYIIIEGLSNDNTLEIINKYKNEIDIILSEHDRGLYNAMNKGISLASGKLIGILNSGDIFSNNLFEKIISLNKKLKNKFIIHGNMHIVDGENKILKTLNKGNNIKLLRKSCVIAHPTSFIPKSIYDNVGLYDENFNIVADYDFFVRAILINKFNDHYLNEIFVYFLAGGVSDNTLKCIIENHEVRRKHGLNYYISLFDTLFLVFKLFIKKILKQNSW